MTEIEIGFAPKLQFLSDDDKQKIPDGQASFEAGLEAAMAVWIGSNLMTWATLTSAAPTACSGPTPN
ncbi:MAG: hypothetical protein QNJ22_07510 [Desulfosarcinaceae bacterium]|nr:hypothetical protein [Desulfosarcinaceae bacterium]